MSLDNAELPESNNVGVCLKEESDMVVTHQRVSASVT